MATPMFDPDQLVNQFASASAKQGDQLRQAVCDATLRALQARELTLKNIRATLKGVTDAAGSGLAQNLTAGADAPALLDKAVAGMDDALLRAVQANHTALQTLMAQGATLQDKTLKKALDEVDRVEETLIGVLQKAAQGADGAFGPMWASAAERLQAGGSASGAQAAATVEALMGQMTSTMKSARQTSLKAAQALAESYAALASGVLIGMQQALQASSRVAAAAAAPPAAAPAASPAAPPAAARKTSK